MQNQSTSITGIVNDMFISQTSTCYGLRSLSGGWTYWCTMWYTRTVFVYCNWVDTRWQQYSTHLHTNSTQNNTIIQNTQNITYITTRILKHYNKNNLHSWTEAYITHNKSIQNTQLYRLIWEVRAVPRLCELYPGICLTTEEKLRKNLC
jgi:hypothetical protein